jgi:hypothetical protein
MADMMKASVTPGIGGAVKLAPDDSAQAVDACDAPRA